MKYVPVEKETFYNVDTKIGKTVTTVRRVNEETGELEIIAKEKTTSFGRPAYVQLSQKKILELVCKLSHTAFISFNVLVSQMTRSTNFVHLTQQEVADLMGASIRTVARGFVELVKSDLVRKKSDGNWMLNPEYVTGCSSDRVPMLIDQYFSLPASNENTDTKTLDKGEE